MTDKKPPGTDATKRHQELKPEPGPFGALSPTYRIKRRQQRILAEIERNRQGNHKVPTWALVVILLLLVGGWILLIALS